MHDQLRDHLLALLRGGNAHMPFGEAVADLPMDRINDVPPNGLYSSWQLVEHMRRTQRDILDFITDPNYQEGTWPDDYWPAKDRTATADDWNKTIAAIQADQSALEGLVSDPQADFFAPIPWGDGQTLLREVLLVADHQAYHIGELGALRQLMQTWSPEHDLDG